MGRRVLLVTVLAAVFGCTSPTLPLPPPTDPSITEDTTPDVFHLASVQGAQPNALIIVVNRDTTFAPNDRVTGTIADAQGSWALDVKAHTGDLLDISQNNGNTASPTTTVTVP
jgi:hypothetical protein